MLTRAGVPARRRGVVALVVALVCMSAGARADAVVVVPCAAGGPGLQAAIADAEASGGATVVLAEGCVYTLTRPSHAETQDGLPPISSVITVVGNDATITRAASAPEFRFFRTTRTGRLAIHNTTLTGGVAKYGGAVYNAGALTVVGSTLSGNRTSAGGMGGAVYNTGQTVVHVHIGLIGVYPYVSPDGGVGSVRLIDSTVAGNSAGYGGGIGADLSRHPAGIFVTLQGTTVSRNTAALGGGIHANVAMTDSRVTNNEAIAGVSWSGEGGGIYAYEAVLRSSVLAGNRATGNGGGIWGQPHLFDSVVSNNSASGDGGGIYIAWWFAAPTFVKSQVTSNSARDGGGMHHYGASKVVPPDTMKNNVPNDCAPAGSCMSF